MSAPKILIAGLGGVGGALAKRLVTRGWGVHVLGRNSDKVSALTSQLAALNSQALITSSVADVLQPADMVRAVDLIVVNHFPCINNNNQ
jgi:NAD(P)-dependent dehydrogenase (short-subunit alcohol dehydrogenase family)